MHETFARHNVSAAPTPPPPKRVFRNTENPLKNNFENRVTDAKGAYPCFMAIEGRREYDLISSSYRVIESETEIENNVFHNAGQAATSVVIDRYRQPKGSNMVYKILLIGWTINGKFHPAKF